MLSSGEGAAIKRRRGGCGESLRRLRSGLRMRTAARPCETGTVWKPARPRAKVEAAAS